MIVVIAWIVKVVVVGIVTVILVIVGIDMKLEVKEL